MLSQDVFIRHIVPHLGAQELGRLMQTSEWFLTTLWIDGAWEHIKQRLTKEIPMLQRYVFDAFPWRKAKKRKSEARSRAFKSPRGGTWYCLKTYISKLRNATGVRNLLRDIHCLGSNVISKTVLYSFY